MDLMEYVRKEEIMLNIVISGWMFAVLITGFLLIFVGAIGGNFSKKFNTWNIWDIILLVGIVITFIFGSYFEII